jgi:hypothetical protein
LGCELLNRREETPGGRRELHRADVPLGESLW